MMVGAEGFEPPTLCSQSRCATRLRYAPTVFSLLYRVRDGLQNVRNRLGVPEANSECNSP
jgi:hypothetical protein